MAWPPATHQDVQDEVAALMSGTVATVDGSGTKLTTSATAPTSPADNDLWLDPTGGIGVAIVDAYKRLVTVATSGAAYTFDLTQGTTFDVTQSANCTFTMPAQPPVGYAASFTVWLRQNGTGGWVPTFSGVKWASGVVPSFSMAATALDIITFTSVGTAWVGLVSALAVA
jgi:hypothetical protein